MSNLTETLEGYQVSRLEHSLQSATKALKAGEDEEIIVAALLEPPPSPEKTGIFFFIFISYFDLLFIIFFFLKKYTLFNAELFSSLIFFLNFPVNLNLSFFPFIFLIIIWSWRLVKKIID